MQTLIKCHGLIIRSEIMTIWHGEKGRTATGALIHTARKKRKYELGSHPMMTKIAKAKIVLKKTKGGQYKVKAAAIEFANVLDAKKKIIKKVKITHVLENKANPHFVRRNVITKGCVIKTELGKARITSRPSQHGVVNAILIE
jgi:small subunit ribosomal protein S8e